MGMSAAERVGIGVIRVLPHAARLVEVPVIGDGIQALVYIGINGGIGVDEVRARNEVPEVSGDGVDEKAVPVFVPIMAPRVGGAAGEDLDNLSLGMKAPHTAFDWNSQRVRGSGDSEPARTGMTTAPVK